MERKITHKLSYHSLRPMGDRTSDTTLLTDIVISSDSNIARYINEKKIDTEEWPRSFRDFGTRTQHFSAEDNRDTARQC